MVLTTEKFNDRKIQDKLEVTDCVKAGASGWAVNMNT